MCDCDGCQREAFGIEAYRSGWRRPEESRRKHNFYGKGLNMLSAKKAVSSRGGEGGTLLKGSMVPMKQKEVEIRITGVREAPDNFSSAIICDIDPLYDAQAWAPNKTNLKLLAAGLPDDDLEGLIGATVKLSMTMARNPKAGGALVRSFLVAGIKLQGSRKMKDISDDDIPF